MIALKTEERYIMKRIIIAILAAGMALSIVACSNANDNTSSNKSETSVKTSSATEVSGNNSKTAEKQESSREESSTTESVDDSNKTSSESSKSKPKSKDVIVYNDVEISVGAEVSGLVKKLGDPDFEETIDPEFEGGEKSYSYSYDNMTIYAYEKDGKRYVSDIYVSGPGEAKAGSGIIVGSSRNDVSKAYGDAGKDDTVTYEIGSNIITFMLQDDSVTDISVGMGLDDESL